MLEIERKWLIEEMPALTAADTRCTSEQLYLSFLPEVRIRRKHSSGKGLTHKLTLKGVGTISRLEIEKELTEAEYEKLKSKLFDGRSKIVRKVGARLPVGGYLSHISTVCRHFNYLEIEFPSLEEAEAFVAPAWFGKEITNTFRMQDYAAGKWSPEMEE